MSTGTPTPNFGMHNWLGVDNVSRTELNANFATIDSLARAITCTSVTQPSTPFAGQMIYETDTLRYRIRDTANANWVTVASVVFNCTAGTRPANTFAGQTIFETDTRATYVRSSGNTQWQLVNGIPAVASTASIATATLNNFLYDTTEAVFKRYNGSGWVLHDGNKRTVYKAATESVTNTTTLQNDDVFSFAIVANSAYKMKSFLPYDGAGAPGGGLKSNFTGPAGASMFWANYGPNQNALAEYDVVVQTLNGGTRGSGSNGATIMSARPAGIVVVGGTAGTLQYQWAQGAASGTATRILGGAWMSLTKIA